MATGIRGGIIYIRSEVPESRLGVAMKIMEIEKKDKEFLRAVLKEFCETFGYDLEEVLKAKFTKIAPTTHRPFGEMYID